MQTLDAHAAQLSSAGFEQVVTKDLTAELVQQLQWELIKVAGAGQHDAAKSATNGSWCSESDTAASTTPTASSTTDSTSSSSADEAIADTAAVVASWEARLARAQAGEQLWGLIQAVKPAGAWH
jgi:hypothetical protein